MVRVDGLPDQFRCSFRAEWRQSASKLAAVFRKVGSRMSVLTSIHGTSFALETPFELELRF